jgi:predicted DNA-binding protein (MmcQ/YjbR family)
MPKKADRRDADSDPLVAFCRALPGATEDVKWGNDLVFSVGGKMFAGFALPDLEPIGFKVDPMVFSALVGQNGIVPAPYAARFHWVSVTERDRLSVAALEDFLAESHALVAAKLPRKARERLGLST